jgi:hypothetical protein
MGQGRLNYKVIKLDGRHTGSNMFKYYISPRGIYSHAISRPLFNDWRSWCWTQWGPSGEREWPMCEQWAWDTEHHHLRIYLHSDKELSMFHLKWG